MPYFEVKADYIGAE